MTRFTLAFLATVALITAPPALAVEFFDDFEDGNLDGWECDTCEQWFVSCANSEGTAFVMLPDTPQLASRICIGELQWTDFILDVDVRGLIGGDKGIFFHHTGVGTQDTYYSVGMTMDTIFLTKRSDPSGQGSILAQAPHPFTNWVWHHVRIEVQGPRIAVWIDGDQYFDYVDPHPLLVGGVCLEAYTGWGVASVTQWDNVFLTEGAVSVAPSSWGQIKHQAGK
jgi:hypothetical protein